LGTNVAIKDYEELSPNSLSINRIDLTIVGPEGPLERRSVVDVFKAKGLVIFGPSPKPLHS
jgi:phosphoribosylamine-glycine ligase